MDDWKIRERNYKLSSNVSLPLAFTKGCFLELILFLLLIHSATHYRRAAGKAPPLDELENR